MAATATRVSRGKSGRGKNRREVLPDYWQRAAPDLKFGEEDFRVTVLRPQEKNPADRKSALDSFVTDVEWEDAGPILHGSVTLTTEKETKPLAVGEGDVIRLESAHRRGIHYVTVWDMRVEDVNENASDGTIELTLSDELAWLQKSREDWSFKASGLKQKTGKKTKKEKEEAKEKGEKQEGEGVGDVRFKRAHGWYCHEIAEEVCRRYGVKVRRLAKGTHLIKNLTEQNASPLEVIMKAYKIERENTGRRFVVRFRRGKLEVGVMVRSKTMLLIGETLIEATVSRALQKGLATAATVTATIKGKKKQKHDKLETTVVAKRASKRYGYVHTTIHLEDPVSSKAEMRKLAKRKLITSMRPSREVSLEHPGISTLFRGDSIKLQLPELGLAEIVYVKTVSHSVSAGDYTMSVTCGFQDPYVDKQGEEIRKKICEEARKHKRKTPGFCGGRKRPQPKTAVSRAEEARR